jgi:7-cyano-7-deazaguanine synthase
LSSNLPAVLLLSGGLDSTTTLAVAQRDGFACHCLTVDYGQRHQIELAAARRIAAKMKVASHRVVGVDLRAIGGSALTAEIPVPKHQRPDADTVPITYVPARNTLLLALLLGLAEVVGAVDLFIGANAVDYSGYPDCRPEFLQEFERLAALATRSGVEGKAHFKVRAPLLDMSKAEIIRLGTGLGVDYALTHSCYDPTDAGLACGACESCNLRQRGFVEAGVPDPTRYAGIAATS